MLEQLNWPIIVGESISGLMGGVISGLLILSVTYIINIFDNKRKKQAEKEFLLIKEEINNLGELNKVIDENIMVLKSFKRKQENETSILNLQKLPKQLFLTVELIYTGVFNEDNMKILHEKYEPIQESLIRFIEEMSTDDKDSKIISDKDLLNEIIKMMTDLKREIIVMKKNIYLEL
ncbi:hypothetical protein PML80_03630 [Aerococcus urinaeequi]|uniref:Uncharacterized protein n=1 Tax=Aerococcus urinaeequi TaxID=51665 RepID=A0AAE9XT45_9LACT|nr:hypothetical protein [Aerococcus urinaeequi]WCG38424.1 hypothetical protein PML80_03630 [Aerococcus urinaeequi]